MMRGWESGLIKGAAVVAALLGGSAAFAQVDPKVPVTFRQQVPADTCSETPCSGGVVSQSRSFKGTTFQSQVTYKWTIQNNASSDLNRAFVKLTVANADGSDPAAIDSVVTSFDLPPEACTYSSTLSDRDTVQCELGTLARSSAQVAVYFIVNVPKDGTQLTVGWQGGGYEGQGGTNGCCQPSGQYLTALVDKLVDKSYQYTLQSFVKKEGTQLFTGDAYIPMPGTRSTTADLNTTFVGIPKIAETYGTSATDIEQFLGTIFESSLSCNSVVFKQNQCYRSELTISKADFSKNGTVEWFSVDGDFLHQAAGAPDELLDIVIRIDSSALKGGAKIDDVAVTYTETGGNLAKTVPLCPVPQPNTGKLYRSDLSADTLLLHKGSLPCYTKKFIWPNNTTPAELKGDLEIRAKHFMNGGWTIL
jgi:hypothetical protein